MARRLEVSSMNPISTPVSKSFVGTADPANTHPAGVWDPITLGFLHELASPLARILIQQTTAAKGSIARAATINQKKCLTKNCSNEKLRLR